MSGFILAFNEARGHPIERMNYIEDLKTRSKIQSLAVQTEKY